MTIQTKLPPNEFTTLTLKARGPRRGARDLGSMVLGPAAQPNGFGTVTPLPLVADRDPSKTNQRQLCRGNASNSSTIRGPMPTALDSWPTGLGKMV